MAEAERVTTTSAFATESAERDASLSTLLFPCILVFMHCEREGHDRVEMVLLDEKHERGTLAYVCPVCGWEERKCGRTVWQNVRAAIARLSDSISDTLDALLLEKPKLKVRSDVKIDRDRRELRVGSGPSLPLAEIEVRIYRNRSEGNYFSWGDGADSVYSEKTTVLTYEVYVKHCNSRITLAEFGSRSAAENYASELRDAMR